MDEARLDAFVPTLGETMVGGFTFKRCLTAGSILVYSLAAGGAAEAADAFGIRAQSTYFTGLANAGAAAGGDVSSVLWNSAATAVAPGFNSSSSYTAYVVTLDQRATDGLFVDAGLPVTADSGTNTVAASSVYTYQINDQFYAGLALNAPFGIVTKPDRYWAGSPFASTERVFSFDINPTLAYKVTPTLSVGVGVQALYYQVRLAQGSNPLALNTPANAFRADDWGIGATAGVLWEAVPGTFVGLGYRSSVSLDLEGSFRGYAPYLDPTGANLIYTRAKLSQTLPDQVTASLRHTVSPGFLLLGTVQWENWSRFGDHAITSPLGTVNRINFNYRDSWSVSVGAEYQYSPDITVRAGVAYDVAPITDFERDSAVPDSNDVVVSVGGSYRWSDSIRVDVAYAHVFFEDANWCIGSPLDTGTTHCVGGAQDVLVRGSSDNSADVFSVGLKYSQAPAVTLEPYK